MAPDDPDRSPARRTPVAALLGANALSLIGNQLTVVAVPWFVLQTTGSAARTGLTGFAGALAFIGAALIGGAVVDRLGPRRTSVATDLLSGVAVALIPLLHRTVGLAFWQLLALVFLRALLNTPGGTARQSLLPELVALAGVRRERGNAAYQAIQNLSQLAGPVLAGLLIAALGPVEVLWVDAASFALSAGIIAAAVPPPAPAPASPASEPAPGLLADLREGLRFLFRDRLVFAITVTSTGGNFLASALFAVILPVYARDRFGSAVDLGLLLGGFGGGALAGSLLYGAVGTRLPRQGTLIAGAALAGLPLWVLGAVPAPALATAVGALGVLGVGLGAINPLAFTLLQERTPAALRGRVFGATFALGGFAAPVAVLLAGYLLEGIAPATALLGEAGGFLALTIWFAAHPAFRRLEPRLIEARGAGSGREPPFKP